MAKAVGISLRTLQRVWQAHRLRTCKRSINPAFVEKVEGTVGL